jgi:hypothetical protein
VVDQGQRAWLGVGQVCCSGIVQAPWSLCHAAIAIAQYFLGRAGMLRFAGKRLPASPERSSC